MSTHDDLRQRMARVIDEYVQLDKDLRKAEGNHFRVSIFGSARIQPDDEIYKGVYEVARQLAVQGIDIVTGGGPGLMEAANRAVRDAKVRRVRSYGLPLDIPGLMEVANAHLDIKSMHRRFSSRLDEFMRLSDAVIVAPGGIGTLLELFYVWQLLQLAMIEPRPVVLLGRKFWTGLIDWMEETVLDRKLISPPDMNTIHIVDTPDEAVAAILPAFEAFRERRRTERAALRAEKAATLQKVEEEVEAVGDMLERAKSEPLPVIVGPSVPNSGVKSPGDQRRVPTISKVVTPVDAANLAARTGTVRPLRTRRPRPKRRR